MTRYWIVRRTGSLPSCYRWWGFDAEDLSKGPMSGSRRTKAEITADLVDSGAVVITEPMMAALPLYVRMRQNGEIILTHEEMDQIPKLRAIAKRDGLVLAQAREQMTRNHSRWSYRPTRVAAVVPGSGGVIARFDRSVTTVMTEGAVL